MAIANSTEKKFSNYSRSKKKQYLIVTFLNHFMMVCWKLLLKASSVWFGLYKMGLHLILHLKQLVM